MTTVADQEAARVRLNECLGQNIYSEEDMEIEDLALLYDGIVSFLALYDQAVGDEDVPDDLDTATKREINTARTLLVQALDGIEKTSADRLGDFEGTEDDL